MTGDKSPVVFFKIRLLNSANRAFPLPENIFKESPGGDASIRIPFCGIIYITTNRTAISFHKYKSKYRISGFILVQAYFFGVSVNCNCSCYVFLSIVNHG